MAEMTPDPAPPAGTGARETLAVMVTIPQALFDRMMDALESDAVEPRRAAFEAAQDFFDEPAHARCQCGHAAGDHREGGLSENIIVLPRCRRCRCEGFAVVSQQHPAAARIAACVERLEKALYSLACRPLPRMEPCWCKAITIGDEGQVEHDAHCRDVEGVVREAATLLREIRGTWL